MRKIWFSTFAAGILMFAILSVANAAGGCYTFLCSPSAVPDPVVAKTGMSVQVAFGPFSNGCTGVSDWGPPPDCDEHGVCKIYVLVRCSSAACMCTMAVHTDSHTYQLPPGATQLIIYVNGEVKESIDDLSKLPLITNPDQDPLVSPVGGEVFRVCTLRLVGPWMVLASALTVPLLVVLVKKRR